MKQCPKCETRHGDDAAFCGECGSPLEAAPQLSTEDDAKKEIFREKIKNDPLNPELLREYASFLQEKGAWAESARVISKALALDEENLDFRRMLFEAYLGGGEIEKALEAGRGLLLRTPDDRQLTLRLSEILASHGNVRDWFAFLENAVEKFPDDVELLTQKALAALDMADYGAFNQSLKALAKAHPEHPLAFLERAMAAAINRDDLSARQELERLKESGFVKELDARLIPVHETLLSFALAHEEGGEGRFAAHAQEISALRPGALPPDLRPLAAFAGLRFSGAEAAAGRFDQAFKALDMAEAMGAGEEAAKKRAEVFALKGQEAMEAGDLAAAAKDFEQGLQLDRENRVCVECLAAIEQKKKKSKKVAGLVTLLVVILAAAGFFAWYARHGNIAFESDVPVNFTVTDARYEGNPNTLPVTHAKGKRLRVDFLPAGSYILRVEEEGYEVRKIPFTIGWLTRIDQKVSLKPLYGTLKVASRPEGAKVLLDGKAAGETPLALDRALARKTEVVLEKGGYYWKGEVVVQEGQTADLGTIHLPFDATRLSKKEFENPAKDGLFYFADFETENGGWETESFDICSTVVGDGVLRYSTKGSSAHSWGRGHKAVGDFLYGGRVRKVSPGYEKAYYGLVFRATSEGDYKRWGFFGVNDRGNFKAMEISKQGSNANLVTGKGLSVNGWVHLAIEAVGENLRFFVDGKLVGESATRLSRGWYTGSAEGEVGIGIDDPKVTVEYDDLYIREIPYSWTLGPEVYAEDFSSPDQKTKDAYSPAVIAKGEARMEYENGWRWVTFQPVKSDNFSYRVSARGDDTWGPVFLSTIEEEQDGNQTNSYWCYLSFTIDKSRMWELFYYDGRRRKKDFLQKGKSLYIKPKEVNEIRVDKAGREIRIFVNGEYLTCYDLGNKPETNRLPKGEIGFLVEDGATVFDNVRLNALE